MKRLLLNVIVLVFLVGLLAGCSNSNGVVPPPPQEAEKFVGLWINQDQSSPKINVTKCRIELVGKNLYIDLWCRVSTAGENYIGQQIIDAEEAKNGVLELTWVADLGVHVDRLTLVDNDNKLKIYSTFNPYNPNWSVVTSTDYLLKAE
jgi:hypothetical protein